MSTSERISATEQSAPPATAPSRVWPLIGLVATSLVLLMEVLRTLYPLGYALVGDLGFVVTPLVLVTVFLAPLLVLLMRPVRTRTGLIGGVVALAAARGVLQLGTPAFPIAVMATVVALAAITIVLAGALNHPRGALVLALGFVVAAGADAALKSAFGAWDHVWQSGLWSMLATAGLCITAIVFALATDVTDDATSTEPERGRLGRVFAVTLLLMPTMTMLASVAYVGSSSERSLPTTALACIGAAAMATLATSAAAAARIGRRGALGAAVMTAAVMYLMATTTGVAVLLLAVVGQCLIGVLLVGVLRAEPRQCHRRGSLGSALGATLGFVTMFVLTLLQPMHYEMPLPVSNVWLPSIAVALSALGLLAARATDDDIGASDTVGRGVPWALALGLGVVAVGVAAGSAAAAHDRVPAVTGDLPLRVATFNIDQAATASGAIDFAAAADQIDALDADIVALQEVGRGWSLSGMNDFVAWLQQSRGWTLHIVPAADRQFVNVLITRVDVSAVHRVNLPKGDGSMARSAIVAELSSADGPITVIATHLQHRNSAAGIDARRQELAVILAVWGGAPRTVLLGDFNVDNRPAPDGGARLLVSPEHEFTLQPVIDAGFITTQPTERCTLPTSNDNCSDYILITPDLRFAAPVEVLDNAEVGDHRPVVGVIAAG